MTWSGCARRLLRERRGRAAPVALRTDGGLGRQGLQALRPGSQAMRLAMRATAASSLPPFAITSGDSGGS